MKSLGEQLNSAGVGRVSLDQPLSAYTTWRIGGPVDIMVEPESAIQVSAILKILTSRQIPWVVVGHGSNLLFDDKGYRGVVIRIADRMARCRQSGEAVWVESGAWVPLLAANAARAGLAGLEHTIGIPGTIGGLLCMNGGSLRRAIGNNVQAVYVVDESGDAIEMSAEACGFEYRTSIMQQKRMIVTAVDLKMTQGDPIEIRRTMLEILRERRSKFPGKIPNCGSVFSSSENMYREVGPPGRLIEACGLKGLRIGNAEVSEQHANFILNRGNASSKDVLALIQTIRNQVLDQFDYAMECEVRYVSPEGWVEPAHQGVAQGD